MDRIKIKTKWDSITYSSNVTDQIKRKKNKEYTKKNRRHQMRQEAGILPPTPQKH